MKPEIIYLPLSEIKPYENNPRYNESAVDAVAQSIKEFGFKNPIILDKHKVIIAGHTRLKAAEKLGLKEVPCIIADDLTDKQAKAYRLVDNKVGELAEWDFLKLGKEITGLPEYDMEEFGFDLQEIEDKLDLEKELVDDEYEIPETIETRVHTGELWQLGNHRLMCGDSTKAQDVQTLMDGKEADLLYTDPPYNVNIENSQGMTIANDNMDSGLFKEFLAKAFKNASESLKLGGAFYIWYADGESINFRTQCEENGLLVKQCLIWVKNGINFGRQDYKWKHEPCLYGWREGAGHFFVEEYNHPTVIEDNLDLNKMKKEEMKQLIIDMLKDTIPTTVVKYDKPLKNDLHPTMKPVPMCGQMIKNSSRNKEIVLDLFGGSGSTLIACEQLNRQCYTMELDEKYASVIVDRWEKFTGKVAKKIC